MEEQVEPVLEEQENPEADSPPTLAELIEQHPEEDPTSDPS